MAKLESPFTSLYRDDKTPKTIREYISENPSLIDVFVMGGVLGAIKSLCDGASFEYCFEGMPKNSCLCISTVGCMKNPYVKERFLRGLDEVFKQLAPSQAILYGKVTDDVLEHVNCPYVQVASEMKQRIETWKNSL